MSSSIYLNKLSQLLSLTGSTIEDQILQISSSLQTTISPMTGKLSLGLGTIPDLSLFNTTFSNLLKDHELLFVETENLEQYALSMYNYIFSELNDLSASLKKLNSQFTDYKLYSTDTSGAYFLSDSFVSFDKIDAQSSLLTTNECTVDLAAGAVCLPVEKISQVRIVELPIISSSSNGVSGNNKQTGAALHGNITEMFDGNTDSWFEYERVVSVDDGVPLVLNLVLTISESTINYLSFDPVNFGTSSLVEIVSIDVSSDGVSFTTVGSNLSLNPTSSKYSGKGIFRFSPTLAKYVRLCLKQSSPYIISTSSERAWRYAIGIREIYIATEEYKSKGEIISSSHILPREIGKVALQTTGNGSINYYLSPDNSSWYGIRPLTSVGSANTTQTIPEVLDFNGVSSSAIITSPVKSLRFKAVLEQSTSSVSNTVLTTSTELLQKPSSSPFSLKLKSSPLVDTTRIYDPSFGSRGKKEPYYLSIGNGNKLTITLPFEINPEIDKSLYTVEYFATGEITGFPVIESLPQSVFVNGEEWSNNLSSSSTSGSKHYRVNRNQLEFGDGTTGKAVPSGGVVSFYLSRERLYPDIKKVARTNYPSVLTPEKTEVYTIGPTSQSVDILPPGRKNFQLKPHITTIVYSSIVFSDTVTFLNSKSSIGNLAATGDYWIDLETGQLVSWAATTTESTVSYFYEPHVSCKWATTENGDIQILDSWEYSIEEEQLAANTNYASVSQMALVPGSIDFITPSGVIASGVYGTEVSFVDGHQEFSNALATTEEIAAISVGSESNVTRSLALNITTDTSYEVEFSGKHIFRTNVSPAIPSSVGDYSIDRSANTFTVRVGKSQPNPGTVKYFFEDPSVNTTGYYSINYRTGELYFHNPTGSADKIDYKYTKYYANYQIARPIQNFTVKADTVVISGDEILDSDRVPKVNLQGGLISKYFLVTYKTSATSTVEAKYYTPWLYDYTLKII